MMYKEEIKYEIIRVPDHFSDKSLEELLSFLKDVEKKQQNKTSIIYNLDKVLHEDKDLLFKPAR